jgi:predicted amidohydrolase YtcJ
LKADLIVKGGTLFIAKGNVFENGYVAVKGNKVISSGAGDFSEFVSENTQIIEAKDDQFVMPGIHDNHVHLIISGIYEKYLSLKGVLSQQETLDKIEQFAKEIPDGEWVIGIGYNRYVWDDEKFPPREMLDKVTGGKPAFFLDYELHSAWVNSKALEIAGIDKNTADPLYGTIERDENGIPNGYLHELALVLVGKIALNFDKEARRDLIKLYMKRANMWGITSCSDMTPYLGLDLALPETFFDMAEKGQLTVRVNSARNLYEDIENYIEMKRKYGHSATGMYSILYMKQFLDGVIGGHSALLLDPYSDRADGWLGEGLFDVAKLEKAVDDAHKNNVSVRLHACGDGSLRAAMDAYEKATKKHGNMKMRHQIEHVELIHPDDVKRFKELDVIASVQPEHIVSDINTFSNNTYPELLGKDRERYTWAFKTLLDADAVLAFGSDTPVAEGDPFLGMYVARKRVHEDGTPVGGWNPQESLPIDEIISAYTAGAAYAEGKENELGTLEEGKLADIAILDRNLLKVSDEEIKETKVLYTIVDGKVVFDSRKLHK